MMKTTLLIFLINLLLISNDPTQIQAKFESKNFVFKATEVKNKTIKRKFTFKNAGKKSIKIIAVNPSCSCTAPTYSTNSIKPNAEGFIELSTTIEQLKRVHEVDAVVKIGDGTNHQFYNLSIAYAK
jgi:hypothetical protein